MGRSAKLVERLAAERRKPFWSESGHRDYFDGCIRDEQQCRLAYRLRRCGKPVRHGIVGKLAEYRRTRELRSSSNAALQRRVELESILERVPYKRCQNAALACDGSSRRCRLYRD